MMLITKITRSFIIMKFYYGRLKTKRLKEKQITSKNRKTNNIFTLFIIKRFAQMNILK